MSPKRPVCSFDLQPMVRVRVRGTQDQISAIHSWCLEWAQKRARGERKGFTTQFGSSGPSSNSETTRQWFMSFHISTDLVEELRGFLGLINLQEET
jgi:hypothetical protein